MCFKFAALVARAAPAATDAAWSAGSQAIDRLGAAHSNVELADGADAAACFDLCHADNGCESWVYASAECSAGSVPTCALKSAVSEQAHRPEDASGCRVASGVRKAAVQGIKPLLFKPPKLGSVAPSGWLRKQLVIQADSLSGHLDHFW